MSDAARSAVLPQRVLIVLLGALGDVARGTAVAAQLKDLIPGVHVTWLIEPKFHSLLSYSPDVDEVLVFRRGAGLRAMIESVRQLRRHSFDLTLDLQRHLKSGFLSLMSGAPRRIGFHRRNAKEGNWLFNTETIPAAPLESSKLERYMDFIRALGFRELAPQRGAIRAPLDRLQSLRARGELPSENFVALVLGSSWPSKDLPVTGYVRIAELLNGHGVNEIVLVGAADQQSAGVTVRSALPSVRVFDLIGKTDLGELLAVLAGSRVVIGPDSGPAHLAGALNIPYVTLFGPTSALRTAARGNEHLAIASRVACRPCYRRRCPGLDTLCMRLIPLEEVIDKVLPFIEPTRR